MTEPIDEFRGKYFFLSNFYPAPVEYQGYRFENNEAAFQAAKCPERMLDFCNLTPRLAKWLGRKVSLRHDWEIVKYDVMYLWIVPLHRELHFFVKKIFRKALCFSFPEDDFTSLFCFSQVDKALIGGTTEFQPQVFFRFDERPINQNIHL